MHSNEKTLEILTSLFSIIERERGSDFFRADPEELADILYQTAQDYPVLGDLELSIPKTESLTELLKKGVQDLQMRDVLNWLDHEDANIFRISPPEAFDIEENLEEKEIAALHEVAKVLTIKIQG